MTFYFQFELIVIWQIKLIYISFITGLERLSGEDPVRVFQNKQILVIKILIDNVSVYYC